MTHDPMIELRATFFAECEELIEGLHDALQRLQDGCSNPETVNTVFRAVHSIKGNAGAFGLQEVVDFAHGFESAMEEVRAGRVPITPKSVRLFISAADRLQDLVALAQTGAPLMASPDLVGVAPAIGLPSPTEDEIDFTPTPLALDLAEDDTRADPPIWLIRFTPAEGLYRSGNESLWILRALSALGPTTTRCILPDDLPPPTPDNAETALLEWEVRLQGDVTREDIAQVFDFVADVCRLDVTQIDAPLAWQPGPNVAAEADAAPPTPPTSHPGDISPTVRVDLDRIDRLMNQVGELVINQAMLAQSITEAGLSQHASITSGLDSFMMLTRDIQESVMMIRAQPVKSLFQRMARIAREASANSDKQIRFRTEGDGTEIDKTVLERLSDPLTHMVRNAVSHGIEPAAQRHAAGKPAEGSITLSASHRAGRVLIEIADDGAGIDRQKVRAAAIQRGLIAPDAQLCDAEIDNLLFSPGFSTAEQVSSLSGRGVGMDVVRSALSLLGGRIAIASSPGAGTRFSISLPLTLAVLDGMVVSAGGQTLVVPLSAIIETAMLLPERIHHLGSGRAVMMIRQDCVPLFDLGEKLGFPPRRETGAAGIVILIAQEDGRRAALIVDRIMEQRQVVIKGLSEIHGRIPGVAAATILGDGQIALILDPADLVGPAVPPFPSLKAAG